MWKGTPPGLTTPLRALTLYIEGYRQAECAWLHAPAGKKETTTSVQGGNAWSLHLAIYVPKRGLLEVWPLLRGDRVGILDVGPHGRLFNTECSLGGTTFSTPHPSRCFFLSGTSQVLQEVVVYHQDWMNE